MRHILKAGCQAALGLGGVVFSESLFPSSAFGGTSVLWNPTEANTLETPYDWRATTNWLEEEAPTTKDHAAFFQNETVQYITFSGDLTVGAIPVKNSGSRFLISDDTLRTTSTDGLKFTHAGFVDGKGNLTQYSSDRVLNTSTYVYAPWTPASNLSGMWTACGPMHADNGMVTLSVGAPYVRPDRYAVKAGGDRTGETSFKYLTFGSGGFVFCAPRGNPELTGTFRVTKDSPYAYHVSSTAGSVEKFSTGSTVSGVAGLATGTFVKRIFVAANAIELSAPFTGESGEHAFTFGAVTANYVATVGTINMNSGSPGQTINAGKYRAEDSLRIEVNTLITSSQTDKKVDQTFCFNTLSGVSPCYPATYVIRNAKEARGYVDVRNTELEFDATGSAAVEPGLPNTHGLVVVANATAYLTVTNNLAARVGAVTRMEGTVQKKGVGSLQLDMAVTNVNALVVNEGTLVLKAKDASEPILVQSLTVKAGATVAAAEGTRVHVRTMTAEAGSHVTGEVVLFLHGDTDIGTAVPSNLVLAFDGTAAGGGVLTPSGTLPATPVPALWMDASQADSLVLKDETTDRKITEWKDRRGAGYLTSKISASAQNNPTAPTNSAGVVRYVRIPRVDTANVAKSAGLFWNAPVKGIRHVFKVHNVFDGGGTILGGTNVVHFGRENVTSWTQPVLNEASALVKSGYLLENGVVRSMTAGYSAKPAASVDDGNTLSEVVVPAPGAEASAFGSAGASNVRNGCERICEVLVYTNELTYAERQQIEEYLMTKWMYRHAPNTAANAPEQMMSTLSVAGGKTFEVASGVAAQVRAVTGEGTLAKTGAGTLYVKDIASASSLDVRAGTVSIVSRTPSATDLPKASARFDMNDETTRTFVSGSAVNVQKVTDADGGTLYLNASKGLKPSLVTAAAPDPSATVPQLKAGMKYLDFGDLVFQHEGDGIDTGKQCVLTLSTAQKRKYHTFFAVFGSGRGGGTGILGCGSAGYNDGYGIMRNKDCWWRPNGTGGGMTKDEFDVASHDPSTPVFVSAPAGANSMVSSQFRRNGTVIDPNATGYTGGWDLCAFRQYYSSGVGLAALAFDHYSRWSGGQMWGELVLYEDTFTDAQTDAAEAYLAKKWYDRDTVGFRAAAVDALSLRGGTSLEVTGGTPLAVNSLALSYDENASGGYDAAAFTGSADWPAEATVTLAGNRATLKAGTYTLLSGAGLEAGDIASWALVVPDALSSRYAFALAVSETGDLRVKVMKKGHLFFAR